MFSERSDVKRFNFNDSISSKYGLSGGQILEISGPPGSPKERMAINILRSFVEVGEEVIFVDCQNMTTPSILTRALDSPTLQERLHYTSAQTLLEFLMFIRHLPRLLSAHPQVSLLVLSSISMPFKNPNLGISQKNFHLERVKQALSTISALNNVTVVITSQLSTKMVNADGTAGTFDSGAKGTMLPSLGSSYLPNAKAHRVILAPDGMFSGVIKLLSSPTCAPGKIPSKSIPYCIVCAGLHGSL
ncbi:hypothetical protein BJ912DRAFT_600304 [Pholiota molesta]|nr:hypothetical protein BJ912DRAFT_600304 [Pholiota molesta]